MDKNVKLSNTHDPSGRKISLQEIVSNDVNKFEVHIYTCKQTNQPKDFPPRAKKSKKAVSISKRY